MARTLKVPAAKKIESATSMTLSEAVRWAFFRGDLPPSCYVDGVFMPFGGDGHSEEARLVSQDDVRAALASGKIKSWGQRGYAEPEPIPPEFWEEHFGNPITSIEGMIGAFRVILVNRSDVMREWPRRGAVRRGRPREIDWDAMEKLARAAVVNRPDISRHALAESLIADYRDCVDSTRTVNLRTVEKKLVSWGLPPN